MFFSIRRVMPVILCVIYIFLGPGEAATSPAVDKNPDGNILIFWTDGDGLKAVTLMCVLGPFDPIGIVAIPVQVRVKCRGVDYTVAEVYGNLGRQGLTKCLEELFRIPIGCYFSIDQATLDKANLIIGPISMEGKITTMSDVFEGTYTDKPIDPQMEIRHLAVHLVEPRMIIKVPQLIWIISTEVKTNLSLSSITSIYRAVKEQGPGILNKKVLPWHECVVNGRKYRDVPSEAWVQVFQSVVSSRII